MVATSRTVLQTQLSIVVENRNLEHWFLDRQGKVLAWRAWRKTLPAMDNETMLNEVATWWKFVPLVNNAIYPWTPDTWPDPWALIGNGSFCPSAQGLGIFYTLTLINVKCTLVQAMVDNKVKLLVQLNDDRLLNYHDGEIIDIKNAELQILKTWTPSDLARLVKV